MDNEDSLLEGLGARLLYPAIWPGPLFRWFDDGIWDDAEEWKDAP